MASQTGLVSIAPADLSAVTNLCGGVITPSVFYVPIAVADKESVVGLKYYSSFGELEAWVSREG